MQLIAFHVESTSIHHLQMAVRTMIGPCLTMSDIAKLLLFVLQTTGLFNRSHQQKFKETCHSPVFTTAINNLTPVSSKLCLKLCRTCPCFLVRHLGAKASRNKQDYFRQEKKRLNNSYRISRILSEDNLMH